MTESSLLSHVARRLKQLRQAAGYTQEQMGERMGCGLRNYQHFESGRWDLRLSTVTRIARALGVRPMHLFADIEQMSP